MKTVKIQIGLRLFAAALILFLVGTLAGNPMAAFILAALAMQLPTFKFTRWHKGILGDGFTDEEEKQLTKLFEKAGEKHKEAIKTEVDAAVNGLMKSSELEAKFLAMGLKEGVIKEITDAVKAQGEELRKFFDGKKADKGVDELIHEKSAEIKKIAENDGRSSMKIMIPMAAVRKTLVERAAFGSNTLGMRLPDIGQQATMGMSMAPLFRRSGIGPNSNGVIRYYDQDAITRGADVKAEGAAYAESAITWIERTLSVQKITDSIPVTKEAFNDIEFIKGELDRLLNINMLLKEDSQLYSGSGVAPNLKGVNVSAPTAQATLGAAPYVGTVEGANVYDLIAVLRVVISTNAQAKYAPDAVTLNPSDVLRYKLLKGSDGHYVLPPFVTADGRMIDSIRVIESNQVTVNTLTIGDFRYGTLYDMGGIEVEMGWINDQFVKDSFTIKASKREALLVRTVDETAFRKITDITAALALLETI